VYNRRIVQTQEGKSMCGIIGYLDKRSRHEQPIGQILLSMLQALSCRGPDSAGVAIFGSRHPFWVVRLALPGDYLGLTSAREALERLSGKGHIARHDLDGAYARLEIKDTLPTAMAVEQWINAQLPRAESVSVGKQLEIVKQVGSPRQLEETYCISHLDGAHGIGHTRLSTESRVDLSHSQPFWAHGVPDLATVHNGHITNYHKLRRQYEQRGYRFYTENDSEIIGVYLRDRMRAGLSIPDALRASLDDFDGSFSYLAAWSDGLAYVKDRFGFKPLMVAETDDFVAIATEEIALRQAFGRDFVAKEPAPGTMHVWAVQMMGSVVA
jgi:glutamate synthase domain-containing protein 1